MKTKIPAALALVLFFSSASAWAQQKVSILGDSYSTYGGYVTPATNYCWYNGADGGNKADKNDVSAVEQTWWHQLIQALGDTLEINNSFSGATVCCTGYRGEDYSDRAFIVRALNLGNPDIILVFGGTNDSWARVPIGDYRYSGWLKADLYQFRPAFAYLLDLLSRLYPAATVYNITNSELSTDVTSSMETICRHYGVTNVLLHDVDKQWGHPSIAGMKAIADQLYEVINK